VLATVVIVAGMIALAVPGSATFAGEFLIMAGVYAQGWGYSAVVALGVVLAAMYTLRVVSAILHVKPGSAVRDEALDLRPGELALVLPMLLVLLVLSAWPALVSQSSFPGNDAARAIAEAFK
jgi:NADH-quinone oxidoreductase subunit M